MENQNDHKTIFRQWLEKLQQESWQLELLISGFAIVGIFAARTTIKNLETYQELYLFDVAGRFSSAFIFILKKGWLIFFINLIVHVVFRGLWIGAIGLRYVSGDISYENLRYSARFTNFLKQKIGSYDDFIENLERLCSVIFAYTFLLFLLFFSMMLFFIEAGLLGITVVKLFGTSGISAQVMSIAVSLYFFLGLVVFIDLITLGGFKRIKEKTISAIYYYIYRFYSLVTLSFLYRPLLYNFIDNPYTKKLFFLSVPYIGIILLGPQLLKNNPAPYIPDQADLLTQGLLMDDNYYDDQRNLRLQEHPNEERNIHKKSMPAISLEQFRVDKKTSSFFIKLTDDYNDLLEQDKKKKPFVKKGFEFNAFNVNEKLPAELEALDKQRSKERAGILKERLEVARKLNQKTGDKKLTEKRDSINRALSEKDKYWDEIFSKTKDELSKKAIEDFLSYVMVHIDNRPLEMNAKTCLFYNHPHLLERGLRCFFSTDSLETGLHHFRFQHKMIRRDDVIQQKTITLPIIKE